MIAEKSGQNGIRPHKTGGFSRGLSIIQAVCDDKLSKLQEP